MLPERPIAEETAAARIAVFQRALLISELVPQPRGPETSVMGDLAPLSMSAPSLGRGSGASLLALESGAFGVRREKARLRPSPTDLLLLMAGGGGASPAAVGACDLSTAEKDVVGGIGG